MKVQSVQINEETQMVEFSVDGVLFQSIPMPPGMSVAEVEQHIVNASVRYAKNTGTGLLITENGEGN